MSIIRWNWAKSNGVATATETQQSYNALLNKAGTHNFSHKVWNDIVNKVHELVIYCGYLWISQNGNKSDSQMDPGSPFYAKKFNDVIENTRINSWKWQYDESFEGYINRKNFRGDSDAGLGKGDRLYASYLLLFIQQLNNIIDAINANESNVLFDGSISYAENTYVKYNNIYYRKINDASADGVVPPESQNWERCCQPVDVRTNISSILEIIGNLTAIGETLVGEVDLTLSYASTINIHHFKEMAISLMCGGSARAELIIGGLRIIGQANLYLRLLEQENSLVILNSAGVQVSDHSGANLLATNLETLHYGGMGSNVVLNDAHTSNVSSNKSARLVVNYTGETSLVADEQVAAFPGAERRTL